ncbi:PIG-L deacetylase family protein [Brucella thiophenivorans]|uniref:GlcNAc-PI de-N-acetylase family protein n=1 Tax=Brucella thiophenivorans TaxID=571255 RepID=A0A256FLZ0_9HYPH|nr:PIG-L deacetylase family protein [Brucella thiophenivorans]OYR15857.1 glcNAc-PI de-N-acetylase family protein [Brucella thiophenivorans]
MIDLTSLKNFGRPLNILCLGAHSDDIEIGCGGTLLNLIEMGTSLHIDWCVLSGGDQRRAEAEASARDFLRGATSSSIHLAEFEDSYFPAQSRIIKEWLIAQRSRGQPDIVFTHQRQDAHQDHRTVNELTWNIFRDQLILEYEIPKWDGDLGRPNAYVAIPSTILERKIELLMQHFGTQCSKDWFDTETFRGLSRLRGMECRAAEAYAEAFYASKIRIL